jgi:hypothetical protein
MRAWLAALAFLLRVDHSDASIVISQDCNEAIHAYRQKARDVSDALKRYTRCLSDTHGTDDCSSQFHQLRSDQEAFEGIVASYKSECD